MSRPITWDLLVHPFFSMLATDVNYRDTAVRIPNAQHLSAQWKNRVDLLHSEPDRGIIVIGYDFSRVIKDYSRRGVSQNLLYARDAKNFYDRFRRFVRKNLPGRCIFLTDKTSVPRTLEKFLDKVRLQVGNKTGLAYGEEFEVCVDYAMQFSKSTGQHLEKSHELSVSRAVENPRFKFGRLPPHFRAKNILRVRKNPQRI